MKRTLGALAVLLFIATVAIGSAIAIPGLAANPSPEANTNGETP